MPEVPHPGEDHGHAQPVGGVDDVLIFYRAAGLDDGGRSGSGDGFQPVGKREEGIGGGDAALERQHGLHGAESGSIHAAHLAGSNTDRLAVARVDYGV